jgi:hypothetical protein
MQFTHKINTNGAYRIFFGWSVISNVATDLTMLHNYLKHNNILRAVFSPLPLSSLHVTLYNIWANGGPLLDQQKQVLRLRDSANFGIYEAQSRQIGYFNPYNCIDSLLYKIAHNINACKWGNIKLTVKGIVYNSSAIRLVFKKPPKQMNECRQNIIDTVGRNDGLSKYHVTLGYIYKQITHEEKKLIDQEVNILNLLLQGQTINLKAPFVAKFEDMTKFQPFS